MSDDSEAGESGESEADAGEPDDSGAGSPDMGLETRCFL